MQQDPELLEAIEKPSLLIGVGSRRRSASQATDLSSNGGVNVGRLFAAIFNIGDAGMSPIAKVRAISAVYFPEFGDELNELETAADAYELWAMKAGRKRVAKEQAFFDCDCRAPCPCAGQHEAVA